MKLQSSLRETEEFLKKKSRDGGFLQSSEWRRFQEALGRETAYFNYPQDGIVCLGITHQLPLVGNYFFTPRGPVIDIKQKQTLTKRLREFYLLARKQKMSWIRIEPQSKEDLAYFKDFFKKDPFLKAPKNHEPAQTLMINLIGKKEEDLLMAMKPKTRYNIRLSERKNIVIKTITRKSIPAEKERALDQFYQLIQETSRRDQVTFYPINYYRQMLETFSGKHLRLYLAQYQNEIIAGIIVSFYGEVATYLHGASANRHRNLMASYGLQWTAIKEALRCGCTWYDLFGVKLSSLGQPLSSKIKQNNPEDWQGITRFKRGFCPQESPAEFPGCWDIILNQRRYQLYLKAQQAKEFWKEWKKKIKLN